MTDKVLTVKKLSVWAFACRHMMVHEKFPTYREIRDNTSYKSTSELPYVLEDLTELGLFDCIIIDGRKIYNVAHGSWQAPPYYLDLIGLTAANENAEVNESLVKAHINHAISMEKLEKGKLHE